MAITIIQEPYPATPRGQKLLYICSSTNDGQDGFRFGVTVVDSSTSKSYEFFYLPSPSDSQLYFDLSSLTVLRHDESDANLFLSYLPTVVEEANGNGYKQYDVTINEWWQVAGVLTYNAGSDVATSVQVFNAYYQPSNGYRPNVQSGQSVVKFSHNNSNSYVLSDRLQDTHFWPYQSTLAPTINSGIYIPVRRNSYGLLSVLTTATLTNNQAEKYQIEFYNGVSPTPTVYEQFFNGNVIEHLPVYPANLDNNLVGLPYPSTQPNWTHYVVRIKNAVGGNRSYPYVFYNADLYGQTDCRYDSVEVRWVGSRGGWESQAFIKKSEDSYNIERKQFRRILPNVFNRSTRQLYDRQSIVTKVLTATSDWLQEGEFEFLKSLLVSNQVVIVSEGGTFTPVTVDENSYTARRDRNGKKYNLTIKFKYAQDYWT
jgi:hypothetical protein